MTELSFIVPIYNRETHIEKFLEELLAINMQDMEVICVDDGSTDGTARLLDRAAEKSSKIKAYHIQLRAGAGKELCAEQGSRKLYCFLRFRRPDSHRCLQAYVRGC